MYLICMATDLERVKFFLCRQFTGCEDGPPFPCGHRTEANRYCEDWKEIPVYQSDIKYEEGTGDMLLSAESLNRVKKEYEEGQNGQENESENVTGNG